MNLIKRPLIILFIVVCFLSSCVKAQEKSDEMPQSINNKKILIVYLSRTNNTEAVAKMIQQNVGGKLIAIELQKPYPEHYQTTVDQVAKENETGFLPPLKTKIDSIDKYDIVFIGFPTWGMQLPPPIKSFIKQYNLKGKTVIPFNTNAGYGIGNSFETVKQSCTDSKILEGFAVKGGKERDGILFVMKGEKQVKVKQEVDRWLTKIGMH